MILYPKLNVRIESLKVRIFDYHVEDLFMVLYTFQCMFVIRKPKVRTEESKFVILK